MSARRRGIAVGAVLHGALGLLVVCSVLVHPWGRVLGSGKVDVWNHAWGAWWWWESLSAGQLPWHTDLLGWPVGGTLWFIDPVQALVGAPLVPLVGAAAAWNLSMWLLVSFASWAAHRLARALGASTSAAFVASAAYAGSAWIVCELHNGISEAANIGPLALALALCEEAVQARTRLAWVKTGLALGLVAFSSPYLGLGAALVLLLRGLPHLRLAWPGGLVGALLSLLPVLAMRTQLAAPDAIIKRPGGMNEVLAFHNAVDPRTFVLPLGFRSVDLSVEDMEHSMYLGIAVLALALLATVKSPRRALPWVATALVVGLLSLGPFLFWDGAWVSTAEGGRYALPWSFIQQSVPALAMTHSLRLAVAGLALFAGLAAVGAEVLLGPRRAAWLVPLVLFDGLVLSGAPWPIATADARYPAAHTDIAPSSHRQGVLDLPTDVGATMATSRYLFWQTGHRHPIPYIVDARSSTAVLMARPSFRELAALCTGRPDERRRLNMDGIAQGQGDVADLAQDGIRWVVVHRSLDPDAAVRLEARISRDLGPGQVIGDAVRWDLGEDVQVRPGVLRGLAPPDFAPHGLERDP